MLSVRALRCLGRAAAAGSLVVRAGLRQQAQLASLPCQTCLPLAMFSSLAGAEDRSTRRERGTSVAPRNWSQICSR